MLLKTATPTKRAPITLERGTTNQIARKLRVLGHPDRIRILIALANAGGTMTGLELRRVMDRLLRHALSKHLKELRNAHLVTYPARATSVSINPEVAQFLGGFLTQVGKHSTLGAAVGKNGKTSKAEP